MHVLALWYAWNVRDAKFVVRRGECSKCFQNHSHTAKDTKILRPARGTDSGQPPHISHIYFQILIAYKFARGATIINRGARTLFYHSTHTPAFGICIFKMLPFLATRSLIFLMMLASKLQAKVRRKKRAGWENKNRIRISQAKAKTAE